jgi:3-methyl-2-oxobutanoate hydroxymethyltransferase
MGVPVMAHIGFTPQSQNVIGGHIIQGKTQDEIEKILQQAKQLENAGAFSVVLEMVPQDGAKYITENLQIPTISCGAGKYCTAQVMVSDDMLGKFSDFTPKFVRKYGDIKNLILTCAKRYDEDVKSGKYPAGNEVF